MEEKVKFAISADFLKADVRLPKDIQKRIPWILERLRKNPVAPEIQYEKLKGGADQKICLMELYQNYWAVVALEDRTRTCIVLWADQHDEARRWAEDRRCRVNPISGILQVYEIRDAGTVPQNPDEAMFSELVDRELLQLGVPEEQIPYVRTLKDRLELYAAANALPQDAYENLSWIAEGKSKEEVMGMTAEWQRERNSTGSLAEGLDFPASREYFAVMKGEREIFGILAKPRDEFGWRFFLYFLHPAQRQIAEEKYSGSALVQGEAGTGKTVAALHRARHLASRRGKTRKILFFTFSVRKAKNIRGQLKEICTATEFRKIEVSDMESWIARFLQEKGCGDGAETSDMSGCIQFLTPSDCYDHVIVDEGEKFSGEAYQLIRALAGKPHTDDIFIVWDSDQKKHGIPQVLSDSGIQIDGRSSTLKVNFAIMADWEDFRRTLKKCPARFYKKKENSRIWWVAQPDMIGPMMFSFDRKKIYNYWPDYPWNLTAEEKKIFDGENPFWAEFRSEKKIAGDPDNSK